MKIKITRIITDDGSIFVVYPAELADIDGETKIVEIKDSEYGEWERITTAYHDMQSKMRAIFFGL